MPTNKPPIPPADVIPHDPPPVTDSKEPAKNPGKEIDIDDAQIEEPRDDAFKKSAPYGV